MSQDAGGSVGVLAPGAGGRGWGEGGPVVLGQPGRWACLQAVSSDQGWAQPPALP